MKKVYKKLAEEQKSKGIIFTSTLSTERTEQEDDTIHEVKSDQEDRGEVMQRLRDDKFFNNSPFKYNIIRQ